MTAWIMDQVGVLRSVFQLNRWDCSQDKNCKTIMSQDEASIRVNYGKDRFFVKSKQSVSTELYRKVDDHRKVMAACLHLNNGTALMFVRSNKWLYCYHFCFEESGDWEVLTQSADSADSDETSDQQEEPKKKTRKGKDKPKMD